MRLSLMELMRGFMEYADSQGKKYFPPFNSHKWHELLYQIRAELGLKHYFLFDVIGNFDWDGRYPKCRNFNEILFGLGSIVCWQCPENYITLRFVQSQNSLVIYYLGLMQEMFEIAVKTPDFFPADPNSP